MFLKLGGLFFLIALLFWLWAIFDSITTESTRVRNLPKIAWVIVVLLFFWAGALAWALLGRPRRGADPRGSSGPSGPKFGGPGGGWPGGFGGNRPGPGPRGPVGPDDDPEFLRGI
ncbi:MAG: hypothetical protein QOK10_601 [Pseudonocardiales bacterium]|jgi:hypothetical protein|nr:hypothetical protein [Pseudonocardiales bacterium]